jgi:Fungal specific transcription factor domain
MITIGMSLGGDMNAHSLAVEMHEELRWEIYSSKQFRHPAKLWEMQTLLLREIFDKMLCTRHQHEMAHTVLSFVALIVVPWSIVDFDAKRDYAGWVPIP